MCVCCWLDQTNLLTIPFLFKVSDVNFLPFYKWILSPRTWLDFKRAFVFVFCWGVDGQLLFYSAHIFILINLKFATDLTGSDHDSRSSSLSFILSRIMAFTKSS